MSHSLLFAHVRRQMPGASTSSGSTEAHCSPLLHRSNVQGSVNPPHESPSEANGTHTKSVMFSSVRHHCPDGQSVSTVQLTTGAGRHIPIQSEPPLDGSQLSSGLSTQVSLALAHAVPANPPHDDSDALQLSSAITSTLTHRAAH